MQKFHPDPVIFTGVAGGRGSAAIGKMVVGTSYVQHDLDPRPFFDQHHIVSLGTRRIDASPDLVEKVTAAASRFLGQTQVLRGGIVSGDQFIGSPAKMQNLLEETGDLFLDGFLAVDMESAAFMHACEKVGLRGIAVRSISDNADEKASIDFPTFLNQVAAPHSYGLIVEYCKEK